MFLTECMWLADILPDGLALLVVEEAAEAEEV
jgi:hypothetical protein